MFVCSLHHITSVDISTFSSHWRRYTNIHVYRPLSRSDFWVMVDNRPTAVCAATEYQHETTCFTRTILIWTSSGTEMDNKSESFVKVLSSMLTFYRLPFLCVRPFLRLAWSCVYRRLNMSTLCTKYILNALQTLLWTNGVVIKTISAILTRYASIPEQIYH